MDLGLGKKGVVVTGASFGIGRAAAERFAYEGAKVVLVARTQSDLNVAAEEIKRVTNGSVLPVAADVRNMEDIDAMVKQAVNEFGSVDVLVNNAGTGNAYSFDEMDDELLTYDLELKLYGAVHCIRAVLPVLKAGGGGSIINITTPAGKAAPGSSVPTSLSRAAGIALTKSLSKEYAALNITVNTVCVSNIRSRQNQRRWEKMRSQSPNLSLEEFYQEGGKNVPLGRIADANEAGDVIVFLASPRASFITGTSINVDGGAAPTV